MLHRPYCLLELLTAVDNKVPIVGVNIATPRREDGYDFEAASQFLLELDSQLEAATPGATKILAEHGYGAVDVLCHDGDGALHVVEALELMPFVPDFTDHFRETIPKSPTRSMDRKSFSAASNGHAP